jgi:mitochondrial chaperone BCS1
MIVQDAQEFMHSEKWYSERGLPYRRGYLFHGCPGSGKTSLVHAIAGELNLDIYVINLSKWGLDDSGLTELISDLPARSIALIEEIDAAFLRGVSRDAPKSTSGGESTTPSPGVTLSGLLASIDGIQASEGRLLFATTNNYHALDAALIRAGRLDLHVEFTYASQAQAEELFKRFFHATDGPTVVREEKEQKSKPSTTASPRYTTKPEILTSAERDALAKQFGQSIPEKEFAMSSIQGLLLNFKTRPSQVIQEVSLWIDKERTARKERERVLASGVKAESPSPSALSSPPSDSQDKESVVLV